MSNSVSEWLVGLQTGEDTAVNQLWERYANELVNLARANLANAPKVIADEEDVAQSVFRSICRGAAAGRFADREVARRVVVAPAGDHQAKSRQSHSSRKS